MGQTIRQWKIHRMTDKELVDIAQMVNPVVRGWINYYGCFYKSAMNLILHKLNWTLIRWMVKKYKRLKSSKRRARNRLREMAQSKQKLFVHWRMEIIPTVR